MAGAQDGAHMVPETTADAMTIVGGAADTLRAAWTSAESALANAEGQLGGGPMGQAFMAAYRPGAPGTADMIKTGARVLRQLADAGTASVTDYVGTDEARRAAFDGLR